MSRSLPLFLSLCLAGLAGCAGTPPKAVDAKVLEETRAAAGKLATELGGRLKAEMSSNGPVAAISVCKQVAPEIASRISQEKNWQVGRVGTRARNPGNTPNAWQQEALKQFAERLAKGEKPDAMEFTQIERDTAGYGAHLNYAKAVVLQPVCTTCHGAVEGIPEGVRAKLKEDYPNDKATGYQVGDLRGAIVIRRPL
jgi:hypothetical protein